MNYIPPAWLPGGNLQTIYAGRLAQTYEGAAPVYHRERWATPDADFIDLDWLQSQSSSEKPLVVLFHGLEGTSQSHYALAFANYCRSKGLAYVVVHFRGCSGEINLAPRAYHSGDFEEIDWILQRIRSTRTGAIFCVGISLGGNALLRWAQEAGASAKQTVSAISAVCSPIDLAASGMAIGKGFNRHVYTRMFLKTMRPKALLKLQQFPGLFAKAAMDGARDLYDFDNVFTAPLHGFKNTEDYWKIASAKPRLNEIKIPALVVNALNDPFVPASSLPHAREVGSCVTLWQPAQGGHVGFPMGTFPVHIHTMPAQVGAWFQQSQGSAHG
ncbi:MAG: alpha/beta fold hydrolase [Comamonadaceae bacterium]|nr:MAG: alpha/beta fold hydrolase [Comamonadaceae bacterium]